MAWVAIPGKTGWEYDNAPPDPGGAQSALWAKSVAGIRQQPGPSGNQVYVRTRRTAGAAQESGEVSTVANT